MALSPKQFQTGRLKRAADIGNKQLLKTFQDFISKGLSSVQPSSTPKGADKINQLILEQTNKLQTLATDQISGIASEFGISGVDSGDPTITLPTPQTDIEDLNLPDIPEDIPSPVKKLTLSPVEVKISEIDTVPTLIQDQFIQQLLPLNFDSLQEETQNEIEQNLKSTALELAQETLSGKPPYCPADDRLEKVLQRYNRLIEVLEATAKYLNITSISLNVLDQILNGTITAKRALEVAKTAVNQALKIPPLAGFPTPSGITSAITDVTDAINVITYKADGSSKFRENKSKLETGAEFTAKAAVIVNGIVLILNLIKPILQKCGLQPDELGPELNKFIQESKTTNQSNTQQSYQGFTFQIVEVKLPNDPTVTRRVGQALNTEGIIALETEPSFTQNPKVLIEELKLIIDRDNLKAF